MFNRKSINDLLLWHKESKRKPLIVRGARQVGKSSLIKLFSQSAELNLIEINFENISIESLNDKIIDIEKIMRDIELKIGKKINFKNDLIFFDEIQKCPNALLSLRYFYEKKPEIAIIAAGSLLDFLLQDTDISFPVGRVDFFFVGPVSFLEFLRATKQDLLIDEYHKEWNEISETGNQLLMDQYRLYCCIGGMPEAVQTYIETRDLLVVRKIHRSILQTYKADFLKYAKKHEIFRCDKIFDYVPTHLGQKVKYVEIDSNEKSRDLKKAIQTLIYARILHAVNHTNATAVPLRAFMDENIFKLFFLDIGLTLTHTEEEFSNILHGNSILSGATAEQFIGQHLAHLDPKLDSDLFYWLRDKSSAKAEVDFIYSLKKLIIPIEIKSNTSFKLKSLDVFMAQNQHIKCGLLFSGLPYSAKTRKAKVILNNEIKQINYPLINIPLWGIEKINNVLLDLIVNKNT
jgi:hypothetical protein